MNVLYATYNIRHNSSDIYTYAGYFLRIDCNKAKEGLKTAFCSECTLNALAIDELHTHHLSKELVQAVNKYV